MGNMAARKSDPTLHGSTLQGLGCLLVKIGGQAAWRATDFHSCSLQNTTPPPASVPVPHVGGIVMKGSLTVLIGSLPAARQFDIVLEPAAFPPTIPLPPNNTIMMGCPTVLIGDVAFGMMSPANLAEFCKDWTKLRADWPSLTKAQRQERLKELMDKSLGRTGTPPLKSLSDTAAAGANGSYGQTGHEVRVPKGLFEKNDLPGKLGSTLAHEARHAEQCYDNARYLAGRGLNAGQIGSRMGCEKGLAEAAAKNPAASDSPAGQLGRMRDEQKYGSGDTGRNYDKKVRDYQKDEYKKLKEANKDRKNAKGAADQLKADKAVDEAKKRYKSAYNAYYGLPNEQDADETGKALAAMCPAAQ